MYNRFYSFLITHPFLNVKSRDEYIFKLVYFGE
jgi:hypothetical protein